MNENKNPNVTIIIPTFNRTNEIIYNLKLLNKIFKNIGINLPIIIGDDGSNREHQEAIKDYISKSIQDISYLKNENNLGIEKNELKLVSLVKTQYALLLGEDDYLNSSLIKHIIDYTKEGKVNVIIPNYYGINKNGEQLRTPMYRIERDKIIKENDVKYFCYAAQMSGLTFKVEGVCEAYIKRGIKGNSYPQMFFVAYNLEKGNGVRITKHPFKNTVLKQKQFDYSVDNLLIDLLQIVDSIEVNELEKKKVTDFVLSNNVTRYGNAYTWIHPKKLFHKMESYEAIIDEWTIKRIKKYFFLSYLKAPYIIIKYFYVRRNYWKNKIL